MQISGDIDHSCVVVLFLLIQSGQNLLWISSPVLFECDKSTVKISYKSNGIELYTN